MESIRVQSGPLANVAIADPLFLLTSGSFVVGED
jgi:hypothetical protein